MLTIILIYLKYFATFYIEGVTQGELGSVEQRVAQLLTVQIIQNVEETVATHVLMVSNNDIQRLLKNLFYQVLLRDISLDVKVLITAKTKHLAMFII